MSKFEEEHPEPGSGIVDWTPPNMNWNPWINQPMIIDGAEEYQVDLFCRNIFRGGHHVTFMALNQ